MGTSGADSSSSVARSDEERTEEPTEVGRDTEDTEDDEGPSTVSEAVDGAQIETEQADTELDVMADNTQDEAAGPEDSTEEDQQEEVSRTRRTRKPTARLTYFKPGGDPVEIPVSEGQDDTDVAAVQRLDAAENTRKPIPKPRPKPKTPVVPEANRGATTLLQAVIRKLNSLLEFVESG